MVLGEGGLDDDKNGKLNAIQLLHGVYDIQNQYKHDELKWWLVGACATSFLDSFSTWERICLGIHKDSPSGSVTYKVTTARSRLMQEPVIMPEIYLLTAIHKCFLFPHFKWCQLGDSKVGGTPSFLSRHMLVRYFLMIQQVTSVTKGRWREVKEFTDFVATLDNMNNDEEETQIQKVQHFLRIVKASLDKHFKIWIEPDIFFLSVFSKHKIAQQIVLFVQGKEINNSETYHSEVHGYDIKFCEFQKFCKFQKLLKDKCNINAI